MRRPFHCVWHCSTTANIAKSDLLQRHSALHARGRTRIAVSCDACRANKSRCSGGARCQLCTRRGIDCTFQGNLDHAKKALTDIRSISTNASLDEVDSNFNEASLPVALNRHEPLDRGSLQAESTTGRHDWVLDFTIIPSKAKGNVAVRLEPADSGMNAIYELLLGEMPSSLEELAQGSDTMEKFLEASTKTYFERFHLRWPLLNAPPFDPETALFSLTASVCIIGIWLQPHADQSERHNALRVHDALLQRFTYDMVKVKLFVEGQSADLLQVNSDLVLVKTAWPIELFQAILSTLIFSLYRTNKKTLSSALILRSLFITRLRDLGVFNGETVKDHLETHFSGTFTPYTLSKRESFNRLVALTYQFDFYCALLSGTPPILHRQEITTCLTCTFALWNSPGLDIFAKRLQDEPSERCQIQICTMTDSPKSLGSVQLLVEDVLLGLGGALQEIWSLRGSPSSKIHESDHGISQRALLMYKINAWKSELDRIAELVNEKNTVNNAARYLLQAYRREDDSKAAALERIAVLVEDGRILSCYLKMFHYACFAPSEFVQLENPNQNPLTAIRQLTRDGRETLVCALQMLDIANAVDSWHASVNPLISSALAVCLDFTRRVLVAYSGCNYPSEETQSLGEQEFRCWIEVEELFKDHGIPLRIRCLDDWTRPFEKAIQDQEILRETITSLVSP